jgi:hypothetical protein
MRVLGQGPQGAVRAELLPRNRYRTQLCYRPSRRPHDSEIPGVSDCIKAYARVHTPSQFRSNFREADRGAAWKVDAILTVITEATFKDR